MDKFAIQRPPSLGSPDKPNIEQLHTFMDNVAKFTRQITTTKSVTAAYTVEAEIYLVRADATSGAFTVTLPLCGTVGRPLGIIKTDSTANAITVDGNGSETINGAATKTLASQYDVLVLRDNGTSWDIEISIYATVTTISGLAVTDGNFIVGNGTTWVVESGSTARTSLGLGTIATQDANNVSITGGAISGITDLAVADGGTGASTAPTARTNLGLGTISTQDASAVAITGGAIDGTTVGATTRSSGAFTTLDANGNVTLGDNAGDTATVNATPAGQVIGSTYSPTRSAESNLDSNVTMSQAQYMRVGATVTVSGTFTADPTAGGAASFEFTLPVASDVGAAEDVAGVAFCGGIAGQGAQITGSVSNNTAVVSWIAVDTTNQTWSYVMTYQII